MMMMDVISCVCGRVVYVVMLWKLVYEWMEGWMDLLYLSDHEREGRKEEKNDRKRVRKEALEAWMGGGR